MEDREVIRAFVDAGARQGFGDILHIERDALLLHGWWHAAFRVAADAFMVRTDEPPADASALAGLTAGLADRGLEQVGHDLPAMTALTYTELSLGGGVGWALWARSRASGEAALAARVGAESFLQDENLEGPLSTSSSHDLSADLEGGRRMLGLPPTVVVAVGLDPSRLSQLEVAMPECRFESVSLASGPGACGPLTPALVLVDAGQQTAREFIMELRADACGRFIPVVALTPDEVPLGADIALDPDQDPLTWVEPLRRLLP